MVSFYNFCLFINILYLVRYHSHLSFLSLYVVFFSSSSIFKSCLMSRLPQRHFLYIFTFSVYGICINISLNAFKNTEHFKYYNVISLEIRFLPTPGLARLWPCRFPRIVGNFQSPYLLKHIIFEIFLPCLSVGLLFALTAISFFPQVANTVVFNCF